MKKRVYSALVLLIFILGICNIAGLTDKIVYGDEVQVILPMQVIDKGYKVAKDSQFVSVEWNVLEYDILVPEGVDIGVNDYISVDVTMREKGNEIKIIEMAYVTTDYYYLVTSDGIYAGINKGVALFTDNYEGAIKFSQEFVDGKMDVFTGISNLLTIGQIKKLYPDASFIKCDTINEAQ